MLLVTNHGVPDATTSCAHEAAQRFFSLPISTKMAVCCLLSRIMRPHIGHGSDLSIRCADLHDLNQLDIHKSPNFKGYTALLGENTDPANRGDLHEGFDLGWETLTNFETISRDTTDSQSEGAMKGGNVWPDEDEVPGFRKAALEY